MFSKRFELRQLRTKVTSPSSARRATTTVVKCVDMAMTREENEQFVVSDESACWGPGEREGKQRYRERGKDITNEAV